MRLHKAYPARAKVILVTSFKTRWGERVVTSCIKTRIWAAQDIWVSLIALLLRGEKVTFFATHSSRSGLACINQAVMAMHFPPSKHGQSSRLSCAYRVWVHSHDLQTFLIAAIPAAVKQVDIHHWFTRQLRLFGRNCAAKQWLRPKISYHARLAGAIQNGEPEELAICICQRWLVSGLQCWVYALLREQSAV